MKKIITILTALLFISYSYAQSEVRKVADFSEISIKNAFEVVLTKGNNNQVEIEGKDAEHIAKVITEVSGGKLKIYTKGKIKTKESLKLYITYKDLVGINQSGATEISATNIIETSKFYLKGSGATEVSLKLNVEELSIDFSGASELKLDGTTVNFNINLSGASELSASSLKSKNANIDISGASEVQIYVTESIKGQTSGASNIKVKGGVSVDKIKSSGISSITRS